MHGWVKITPLQNAKMLFSQKPIVNTMISHQLAHLISLESNLIKVLIEGPCSSCKSETKNSSIRSMQVKKLLTHTYTHTLGKLVSQPNIVHICRKICRKCRKNQFWQPQASLPNQCFLFSLKKANEIHIQYSPTVVRDALI